MFVFLVVLDFLLNLLTGGLEYFPLFPIPLLDPLSFALANDPLFKVPLLAPVETILIFWSVFALQYGQNLLVVLGIFII